MLTVGSSAMVTAAHQYFAFWLLHICGAFFVGLPVKPAMTKGKAMMSSRHDGIYMSPPT